MFLPPIHQSPEGSTHHVACFFFFLLMPPLSSRTSSPAPTLQGGSFYVFPYVAAVCSAQLMNYGWEQDATNSPELRASLQIHWTQRFCCSSDASSTSKDKILMLNAKINWDNDQEKNKPTTVSASINIKMFHTDVIRGRRRRVCWGWTMRRSSTLHFL